MKKVILLENKDERQKEHIFDMPKYEFFDNVLGDNDCNNLLDKFLQNNSIFDNYDTIIIHESIYDDQKRINLFEVLKNYCSNKNLMMFSGNNTQFSLENESLLRISPLSLYNNIEVFLNAYEKKSSNILMLALGEKWQFNILLNTLEQLNIFIQNNEKESINKSIFSSKSGLLKIKEVNEEIYESIFKNFTSNNLTKIDIETISANLKNMIMETVHE
jgi:hypothetical protein